MNVEQWVLSKFNRLSDNTNLIESTTLTKSVMSKFRLCAWDAQSEITNLMITKRLIRPSFSNDGILQWSLGSATDDEIRAVFKKVKEANDEYDRQEALRG